MSNELTIHSPANSGDTLYAQVESVLGQVWNGTGFESPVHGNWGNYDIAMTEQATSTGIFLASMPAAVAGAYSFIVRKQSGGSPAVGDIVLGSSQLFYWSGTVVVDVGSELATIKTATSQIGSASITVSSPVTTDGGVTIYQYDDYNDTESRSLEWTNSNGDWGPDDITDATVEFVIFDSNGAVKLTADGSVVTPTGTQKVRVELLNTETADLNYKTTYTYQLRLILDSSERQEVIATGTVTVITSGFTS